MSAFLVDPTHIDALITAGLAFRDERHPVTWFHPRPEDRYADLTATRRELTPSTAGQVGAMLLAENMRSVNYRSGSHDWEPPYIFQPLPGVPDPVLVLRAIACLEYQSCEHPGWPESESAAFLDALRHAAIANLPGWDDHAARAWPINDRHVFQRHRAA